jgi:hypothetical protein
MSFLLGFHKKSRFLNMAGHFGIGSANVPARGCGRQSREQSCNHITRLLRRSAAQKESK